MAPTPEPATFVLAPKPAAHPRRENWWPPMGDSWRNKTSNRANALARWRSDDDPALLAARRDLAAERLAAYVTKTIAEEQLSAEQRGHIAAILTGADQ